MGIGNTSKLNRTEEYRNGFEDGYQTALREMREMVGETHQPGRVPEDAIEHRNHPRTKEMP